MNKTILGALALLVGGAIGIGLAYTPEKGTSEHSSVDDKKNVYSDLEKTIREIMAFVQNPTQFTASTCGSTIERVTNELQARNPLYFDRSLIEGSEKKLIEMLWQLRLAIREKFQDFYHQRQLIGPQGADCVEKVRRAFRFARYIEDYLTLFLYKPKPFDSATDQKWINSLQGKSPQLLVSDKEPVVKIKSGDAIMSRGDAFTSAAIARIGNEDAQFSHLSLVYIEGATPDMEYTIEEALTSERVKVIEAHIEVGSFYGTFGKYVQDGHTRLVQYRFPDSKIAHQAALNLYKIVDDYQKGRRKGRAEPDVNDNIPYDFHMNLADRSEIFCSEGTSIAYTDAGVEIPTFPSDIERNPLTEGMGITVFKTFAPADMEVEPHFNMIAEWRDPRKINNALKKDVILASIFKWMKNSEYDFYPDLSHGAKALFAWTARQADLGFVKGQMPKNMSPNTLRMVFILDEIGAKFQDELNKFEIETYQATSLLPGYPQMMERLENFRAQDADLFTDKQKWKNSKVHMRFRPKGMKTPF